ncbi:MAG: hypothetical protein E6Q53_00075 [Candidatus Moraniibacteriota bacterium]|nr:MAG: hypothetical protein E6Q53_00075 [Candidatus Moranbacteria bacterium]
MSLVRSDISRVQMRTSLFLFFGLLILSVTFFVSADDTMTDKNIFQDSDQDGLSNEEEALYKTDPLDKDSDDDGYTDGVEVESGYNPLKPAPGDKLVDTKETNQTEDGGSATDNNLTAQVSQQIASMVQDSADGEGEAVTLETITESVQGVLDQSDQEIILPEVNVDEIKIKEVSKKLKEKQRLEKEREDAVEYLTVMAYILANNSPKKFHSENDLSSLLTSLGTDSLSAITLGNTKYLDDLSEKGKKILDETKDIEVPEGMLEVHVRAIKMAKYSMTLKDEVKQTNPSDPLGQISSLSKMQGFFGVVADFSQEIYSKMAEYDIKEIPIDL